MNKMITIAKYWRRWSVRLIVMVLNRPTRPDPVTWEAART